MNHNKTPLMSRSGLFLVLVVAYMFITPLRATVNFYVDPDFSGVATGASDSPWRSLDNNAWTAINNALPTDDVIVYFSAREVGSDTNEKMTSILILERTDSGPQWLTLDGMSKYNSDDSNPSWQDYVGSSKFEIQSSGTSIRTRTGGDNTRRFRISLRGFATLTGAGKCAEISNVEDLILENSEFSHAAGSSIGPCLHFDPYLFTQSGTVWSKNVTFRNNVIHDTYGEAVYVNGHKTSSTEGNPSIDNLLIENNDIYNAGVYGGQGDGLDIKDGITNLVVRGNTIYENPVYGIVSDSGGIYENNFIHTNQLDGVSMATIEGNLANRANTVIRNNIIIGNGRSGIDFRGPGTDPDDWTNVWIVNNTIALNGLDGIRDRDDRTDPTLHLLNNIMWGNTALQLNVLEASYLLSHDGNLYGKDSGGNLVQIATTVYDASNISNLGGAATGNPEFINSGTPYTDENFSLQAISPAMGIAIFQTTYRNDYFGRNRGPGSEWESGAIEFNVGGVPPDSPTSVRTTVQ